MVKKKLWAGAMLLVLFVSLLPLGRVRAIEAMSTPALSIEETNGEVKKNLQEWQEELHVADPLSSIVRGVAWWLIIQTGNLVNAITGAFDHTYQMLDLYGTQERPGPIQKVVNTYMPIFLGIGIAVFISLTLGVLFSKNQDVVLILKNLLLGISIFVLLPFGFGQISSLTTSIAKNISKTTNSGYEVVDQNITDLYAIDKNYQWMKPRNESLSDQKTKRNYLKSEEEGGKITKQALENININATVDPDKMSKGGKKITSNMLVTNEKGKLTTVALNDGVGKSWWMSLITGDAQYYRYHVHFFTLMFYITLVLVITAFLLYKLLKILIELVMNAAILHATSTMDTKGKRNLEILSKIVSGAGAVVMVVFLQEFFAKGYAITSTLKGGAVVQAIAGIALAFSVIEGPNIFQSTFGIHVGLDSGLKDLMTLSQTSMLLQNGGGAALNLSRSLLHGTAGLAGAATGVAAGAMSGENPFSQAFEGTSGEHNATHDAFQGDNTTQSDGEDNMDEENQNQETFNNENHAEENLNGETLTGDEEEGSALNDTSPELMETLHDQTLQEENDRPQELSESDGQTPLDNEALDNGAAQDASASETEQASPLDETPKNKAASSILDDTLPVEEKAPHFEELEKDQPDSGTFEKAQPDSGQVRRQEMPARAQAQGLGSTIRDLAQTSLSNKINSQKRNVFNSFASSYRTGQALAQGTKNSMRNLSHSLFEEEKTK